MPSIHHKRINPVQISFSAAFLAMWLAVGVSSQVLAANDNPEAVNTLLKEYEASGGQNFSPEAGKTLWSKSFEHNKSPVQRSCVDCHGKDLTQPGRHVRTNRTIEPLAPSVNPERLSSEKKIRKWLKRNCKWTLGRECTSQEKGDLLLWIQSQ